MRAMPVANEFLGLADDDGRGLTMLQIIKLTYIAHGYYLGFTNEPLYTDDTIAWKYGPVIVGVYDMISSPKAFRQSPRVIRGKIAENEFPPVKDEFAKALIKRVWDVYGKYTGWQLTELTHRKNTPWYEVWQQEPNGVIPVQSIARHYKEVIDRAGK